MVRSLRSSHTLFNTWSPPTSPPPADPRRSSVYPPAAASSAIHLVLDPFQGPSPGAQRTSTSTVSDHFSGAGVESCALSPRSSISRSRSSHSHSHERKAARHHHHHHQPTGTASSSAICAEAGGLGLHSPTGSAHYLFPALASTPSALSGLSGRESIATTSTLTACTAYTAIEPHSCARSALAPSSTAQTLRALVDAVPPRSFARSASRAADPPERHRAVLGPAKRVPSASRLALELETKPDPNPNPKIRSSMRTLRRQPSMADLSNLSNGGGSSVGRSKGLAVQVGREKVPALGVLGEVTNWSLGQAVSGPNNNNKPYARSELISPRTIIPPSAADWTAGSSPRPSAAKRRSYTLSGGAPRPPTPPRPSPTLPDVDFGDPLSVSVVIPSPSFSHLDYSTAGSTASSPHAHAHARTPTFSRRASQHALAVLAPSYGGVAMARGETRAGLGTWDSARKIARDDAERRLGAQPSPALALGFLDRPAPVEVAPKRKGSRTSLRRSTSSKQPDRAEAPRARSQSFSARSSKHSHSPAPAPPSPAPLDHALGSFADEVNIDLGGPYSIPHNNSSPGVRGHTALTSEISILASSFDVSLQQRQAESTYSLPSSLEAEAIDLTETRPLPPPTPADLPRRSTSLWRLRDGDDEDKKRGRERPAMRTAKTMQPGELRKAYSAAAPPLRSPSPKAKASARSAQRLSITPSASQPQPQRPSPAQAQVSPAVPGCRSSFMTASGSTSTTTTTARRRGRGLGTFCSPPQAHPPSPVYPSHPTQTPASAPVSRATSGSTPLASATSSLRRVFSKSTLSRSLSQVFDRSSPKSTQSTPKVSVSSPLENPALQPQRPADDGDADGEHKWRESILKEAVNLSYSRTLTLHSVQEATEEVAAAAYRPRSPEKRRPPIPHVLLQAAEVEEKRWTAPYTTQPALGRGHYLKAKDVRRTSARGLSAVDTTPGLAVSVRDASSSTFSPAAAASGTTPKPTPPPRSPMRGTKSPLRTRKPPTPPRSSPRREVTQTSATSGDGSLYLADDSEDHSPSFLSTDPASLPHHRSAQQKQSRSPLQSLRSSLSLRVPSSTLSAPGVGVSSTTPRLVLDELSLRAGSGLEGREDKLHRVREWTYAVEAKGDEARFERGVRQFLVEEKARLARIGRQHSPGA